MNKKTTLNTLKPGEKARINSVNNTGSIKRRLLDIGLVKETEIKSILSSSGNQTLAYLIRGAVIAIRQEDAKNIYIQKV